MTNASVPAVPGRGRPKKLKTCAKCGAVAGVAAMRKHRCPGAPVVVRGAAWRGTR